MRYLILLLLVSCASQPVAVKNNDVLERLSEAGYSTDRCAKYLNDSEVSRAGLALCLGSYLERKTITIKLYADVDPYSLEQSYYHAVNQAGILNSTDGKFYPDQKLTDDELESALEAFLKRRRK